MSGRSLIGIPAVVLAVGVILSGCQSAPVIEVDPSLNAENAGAIFIYRPASDWKAATIDYRVTLDGRYIGSLETGRHIEAYARLGERSITIQGYFLSMADGPSITTTVEAEAGESIFIRFSLYIPSNPIPDIALGRLELQEVPFEVWVRKL
ncbi:MAG: DUF2846 domain-containing protein [Rhodospirillales bacterium]|nr:DUF2846 domain-containing protein [Rhodospirillales bacterium]MDH3910961.1 DUF2846 domain-containing protein [Rhodospirillales bacterium]MDH3918705.1 DUF2846 domain-containing protein [Rhodospirillales bacterium]MDH3968133.1 DUF2846 domain-containing protein [Rhodospirillales bacterium]